MTVQKCASISNLRHKAEVCASVYKLWQCRNVCQHFWVTTV